MKKPIWIITVSAEHMIPDAWRVKGTLTEVKLHLLKESGLSETCTIDDVKSIDDTLYICRELNDEWVMFSATPEREPRPLDKDGSVKEE